MSFKKDFEGWYLIEMQSHENRVEWITGLNASGYAGCSSQGMIVDRRQFPDAVPVRENSLFGVVHPKKVTDKQREKIIRAGRSFPINEQELKWWEDEFKDYKYQLSGKKIDPFEILQLTKNKP